MSPGASLTALIGSAVLVVALLVWFVRKRRRPSAEQPAYKRLERIGEQYYDELYEGSGRRAGAFSEVKECFHSAIEAARRAPRPASRRSSCRAGGTHRP